MRDIVRMILVLTLIGAASGLTLSFVHRGTKERIEYQTIKFVKEPAVKKVLTGYDNDPILDRKKIGVGTDERGNPIELIIFPAKRQGQTFAVAIEGKGKGFGGLIGVMVGISKDGQLLDIGITSHSETPGVGSRVEEASFTDQFRGLSAKGALKADGISGATYSSKGVMSAVSQAIGYVANFREEIF
ncbi:MAG: FMN-binding protein [Deltaproteobacteria bacterium]|nr:MAG: FMN-binding protein [Deltaproteobacteria bacterium]